MGVSIRREREREQRRHLILDAAARTFARRGLELATMDDVASDAQLGKGTLYLYFRNKEELLMGLVVRRQAALLERFEQVNSEALTGLEQCRRLLLAYADHMTAPKHYLKLAFSRWAAGTPFDTDGEQAEQMGSHIKRLFGSVYAAIERGQNDGSISAETPAAQLAVHLWSATNGALLLQLQLGCMPKDSPIALHVLPLEESIDLIINGHRASNKAVDREARP